MHIYHFTSAVERVERGASSKRCCILSSNDDAWGGAEQGDLATRSNTCAICVKSPLYVFVCECVCVRKGLYPCTCCHYIHVCACIYVRISKHNYKCMYRYGPRCDVTDSKKHNYVVECVYKNMLIYTRIHVARGDKND